MTLSRPRVTVVIPAFNASVTLPDTLHSLVAQTFAAWEAIVVDDASTDSTAKVAEEFAERDPRIRVLREPHRGEGGARNIGIEAARTDKLLFLDADDWILPTHLEHTVGVLDRRADIDVACVGWARATPGGGLLEETFGPDLERAFDILARFNPFAVHSCVIRRALLERVGKFEPTLATCADWDFWQRVARTGARFDVDWTVRAIYRLVPQSASNRPLQLLADGLAVIGRGHGADPRVSEPAAEHIAGRPASGLRQARLLFTCWPAGMLLGRGLSAEPVLDAVADDWDPDIDPIQIANSLCRAALVAAAKPPAEWGDLWPQFGRELDPFLGKLEEQSRASGLRRRTRAAVERQISFALPTRPASIGKTLIVAIDACDPQDDIPVDRSIERIRCEVAIEGQKLGSLEMRVADGVVPGAVLADAIAARWAWQILGRFFERTVYPSAQPPAELAAWCVRRCLIDRESTAPETVETLHADHGWTVFLQELFDRRDWPVGAFYDSTGLDAPRSERPAGRLDQIELSDDLPDLLTDAGEVNLTCTVGGAPIGVVAIPVATDRVSAQQIRSAVLEAAGRELYRAVVRQAILSRPLSDHPTSLRERLAQSSAAPRPAQRADEIRVPRRSPGEIRLSTSRAVALPIEAVAALSEMAAAVGEPAIDPPEPASIPARARYAPELIKDRELVSVEGNRPAETPLSDMSTTRLPILMYHRVAPTGAEGTSRYRVHPEGFERQLRWLRDAGYRTVGLQEWCERMLRLEPIAGPAVLLTFDDGCQDFADHAWPLLRSYGLAATLFVVTDLAGRTNCWDASYGESVPLLSWQELARLRDEGVQIESHSSRHARLTGLDTVELAKDLARSRTTLSQRLGVNSRAIAYPHGDADPAVRQIAGACGFLYGLSTWSGISGPGDDPLWLPRVEIAGSDSIEIFAAKVRGDWRGQ